MDSLIFAFDSVAPIIFTVAIGYLLKRIGFMTGDFAKMANRLVFRVFLPVTLFLNVYKIENMSGVSMGYVLYTILAVLVIFLIALAVVNLCTKERSRKGALLQASFRSNYALIGIPLATSLFGDSGAQVATLLSAIVIPAFNVLAVLSLSIFSDVGGGKERIKKVLLGIVKNPLIIGIFAGLVTLGLRALLVRLGSDFRLSDVSSVYKTMDYLSRMSTPLALLVLGAQFEFSAIGYMRREIIVGTVMRCLFVPIFGIGIAYLAFRNSFSGAHFAALVAVFCTPVAVSSVPMAQEMGQDVGLAGQLVVFTTICSAFTVFVVSFLLRSAGIF